MNANRDRRTARIAVPLIAASLLLGACTVMPTGPSVMATPGSRKTMDQYQVDVAQCQQFANNVVVAGSSGIVANAENNAASTAAAGALFGAATGALIGQSGQAAAIGAGTGLLFGGLAGSNYTTMSSHQLQRGYDNAYLQCMYERGNRVPMPRGYATTRTSPSFAPPANSSPSYPAPPRYPPPNTPPPGASSPNVPPASYPPPNVPPGSYPPPDTPPPVYPPQRN